jgi:hypothetical protein
MKKLIALVIVILILLFWRGVNQITIQKGIKCTFHFGYALCVSPTGRAAELPGFFEIIKAGAKF